MRADLITRAQNELHTFERVGKQTSSDLIVALVAAEARAAELERERDEARAERDQLSDEVEELRYEPWPKWADQCRKLYHEFSGTTDADFDHEFDIPDMMRTVLEEFEHEAKRKDHEARVRLEDATSLKRNTTERGTLSFCRSGRPFAPGYRPRWRR